LKSLSAMNLTCN